VLNLGTQRNAAPGRTNIEFPRRPEWTDGPRDHEATKGHPELAAENPWAGPQSRENGICGLILTDGDPER